MKKNNYIPVFFIFTLLLLSCGSSMDYEEEKAKQTFSSTPFNINKVEMSFFTDTLSNQQKELFGKRAVQKVEDYYNYMEIISNKNYDTTLRIHAKTLAAELFLDKKNVEYLLDSIYNNSPDSSFITVHSISMSGMPVIINDSTYIGDINFEEQTNDKKQIRHQRFIIKKVNKNFGQEQHLIWETYLDFND